jgi:integrase
MTELGMKKKEGQALTRVFYENEHGNLKGYKLTKTYFIRSINTAKTYRKCGRWFATWLKEEKGINKINKVTSAIAGEYLQHMDKTYSAWTVKQSLAAINKIFDYNLTGKQLGLKERDFKKIKRSRSGPDSKRPGLIKKYKEHIFLIMACGCRRDSVTRVKYSDVIFDENGIATHVSLVEKGGKPRNAPVLDKYKIEFTEMINKYKYIDGNIFNEFDNHVAAHYYRHLYAKNLYSEFCETKEPTGKLYKGYRKECLIEVSKALGHGEKRLGTVVNNYFY